MIIDITSTHIINHNISKNLVDNWDKLFQKLQKLQRLKIFWCMATKFLNEIPIAFANSKVFLPKENLCKPKLFLANNSLGLTLREKLSLSFLKSTKFPIQHIPSCLCKTNNSRYGERQWWTSILYKMWTMSKISFFWS